MCNVFYMDMFCFEIKAFPLNFPFMWDFSATFLIHLNLRSPDDVTVEDVSVNNPVLFKY